MTTLYILRGVPGSGKSTLAKLISQSLDNCPHYEADMFFIDKDGNYNWSADRLYQAHKWCFEKTKAALEDGKDCIVSNTFVKKRDLNKYKKMAVEVGATPYVVVVQNDFGNIHNVPPEVVQRMRDEFNTELKPTRANPGERHFTKDEEALLEFCAKALGHEFIWNECRDQKAMLITMHYPDRIVKTQSRPFNPYALDRDCYDLITELAIQVQHTKTHICVTRNDVLLSHLERYDIHNGNKQRTLRWAVVNLMEKVKNALGT